MVDWGLFAAFSTVFRPHRGGKAAGEVEMPQGKHLPTDWRFAQSPCAASCVTAHYAKWSQTPGRNHVLLSPESFQLASGGCAFAAACDVQIVCYKEPMTDIVKALV